MALTPGQQAVQTQINSVAGLADQLLAALNSIIPVMQDAGAVEAVSVMTDMRTALTPTSERMDTMAADTAQIASIP